MYRHEGSLCDIPSTNHGVKRVDSDPPVPVFIRTTSMRDMLSFGDVDDLIEAQEDVSELKHSSSNHFSRARGIAIPVPHGKADGPIVGKSFRLSQVAFMS